MYPIFSVLKTILLFILITSAIVVYGSSLATNSLLLIDSDDLTIDQAKQQATFTGKVLVWFDDMLLKANYLEILYEVHNQKRTISEINIPVKLIARRSGDQELLVADSAKYIVGKHELSLFGNVIIQNDKGIIKTDKLVYYTSLNKLNLKK